MEGPTWLIWRSCNQKTKGLKGFPGEVPYQVVHQVFQGCNRQHDHQGDQCCVPGQGCNVGDELGKETWKEQVQVSSFIEKWPPEEANLVMKQNLQDEKSQEVKVGRSLELLVQIQGQEREHVVLVCLDGISLKTRKETREKKKMRHNHATRPCFFGEVIFTQHIQCLISQSGYYSQCSAARKIHNMN